MIDLAHHIAAISRQVAQLDESAETVAVTLSRHYDADIADVWQALTDPERVSRWMLPLRGDLREGGTFELEGNASGEIRICQAPDHLVITFGGPTSVVDLTLTTEGDQTRLSFNHSVPLAMAGSSAGALYVGPGWDGALMSLALYLAGERAEDPVAAANSPEAQQFCARSIDAWVDVLEASRTTDAQSIAAAKQAALAQFAPDLV